MASFERSLLRELKARGISRRDFMGFCSATAALIDLPSSAAAAIVNALETKAKPSVVWLEFQDCAGNTESFLRASKPTAADIILDSLSIDYHETLMAAAGARAENARETTIAKWPATDRFNRPLFAYGKSIHDSCERSAHFDAGQYVEQWGDEGLLGFAVHYVLSGLLLSPSEKSGTMESMFSGYKFVSEHAEANDDEP